jgi:hypothetical protein
VRVVMIVIVENLKKFLFVFSFVNFFIRDKIDVATYAFAFIMVPFLNFNYIFPFIIFFFLTTPSMVFFDETCDHRYVYDHMVTINHKYS